MPRSRTVTTTIPITLELLVEVRARIDPPEPDVGIFHTHTIDQEVLRIGEEETTKSPVVNWCSTPVSSWLYDYILNHHADQIEEALLDAE